MEAWVLKNREAFERDVLQGYCLVSDRLFEQFARMERDGTLSFPLLRELVGESWNKGPLWRLKDTAHHLFSERPEAGSAGAQAGRLLDWTLGYAFHEALKLMEDAHQRQYYLPRLEELAGRQSVPEISAIAAALGLVREGACESMRRECARLQALLLHSRRLFILYFAGRSGQRPLARFLHDAGDLVRRIFQEDYALLISSVYGSAPERMHIEAAHSLLESARMPSARAAVLAALSINPFSREALALKDAHGW